ncbi:uncharacterized protein [Spinacia oleracea]|uniref:Uncharacterized protein isoform X2 n=1 Tax=Spinacia oleracea TaxID=3562 RepID=A0ABM3RED5_SPIOL|nr:uncharacterized protein LOC130468936 isoform X2 [Spinacia oleracea]
MADNTSTPKLPKDENVTASKAAKPSLRTVSFKHIARKPTIPIKKELPKLLTRMSPNSIAQLNKTISASQRSAIENVGFGDLLSLKISKLPLHLGLFLVESFDANTCCLRIHGNEFFITEKDVHEVLGLPLGVEEINLDNDCKDVEILDCWKKQFKKFMKEKAAKKAKKVKAVKGENVKVKETFTQLIPVGVLTDHLKSSKASSDMWLRNYVVLVTSTLIHGGQNQFVNCWILRYFKEMSQIKNLNWCNFVLQCLVNSKMYWEEVEGRWFAGSLVFLMLFYVDKVALEEVRIERSLPIIKGWNCNMLSTREKLEIELGRIAFHGMNDAVDKGETSGTQKQQEEVIENENPEQNVPTEQEVPEYQSKENASACPEENEAPQIVENVNPPVEKNKFQLKQDCILELAVAANELAMAMEKFQLKAQQAYSDFPDDQRIQSLRDSASVVWDNCSSTNNVNQTENVVTPNPNITENQSGIPREERAEIPREERAEIPREERAEIPREESVLRFSQDEDDEFWRNPIVIKAWDDIVEKGIRNKNARCAQELDNEVEVDDTLPGIDTVIKFHENAIFEEAVFLEKEVAERELRLDRRRNQKKRDSPTKGKGPCEVNKRQKVENREVTLSKSLCSPYKDRMVNIKSALTPAQKAIVDYVINPQEPADEKLFVWKVGERDEFSLTRLHFQSFKQGNGMFSPIIDAWSLILNSKEQYKSDSSPARFFFSCLPAVSFYFLLKNLQ